MAEFLMPSLGTDMEAGTLVEWLVKPGDKVKRGDIIAIVETVKGVIEVEVYEDGVVTELLVPAGGEVPVGTLLAFIGEKMPAFTPAQAVAMPAGAPLPSYLTPPPTVSPPTLNGKRLRVSPVARRLAEELGIDLSQIHGTGPNGAISRADVEEAAAAPAGRQTPVKPTAPEPVAAPLQPPEPAPTPPPAPPIETAPRGDVYAGMRRAIAAAMSRANRDIPHYYLETRIDMSHSLAWLEAENLKRPIKERILPAVLLLKAVAKALVAVPDLNGYWIDDQLRRQEAIHIGFAIALRQGGLVTPALHHVDLKNLDELMADLRDLITRTRASRLRSSELTDATITVTNLGDLGVEKVYGVIYPPQVALVGFGKVVEQVWVEKGMLGIRPALTATLAGDHRATDGRVGGQFLEALNRSLQEPDQLAPPA